MHVVIDGELVTRVTTHEGVRDLDIHAQGHGSAAEALPRIGSRALWNLSEILAKRVSNTSRLLS